MNLQSTTEKIPHPSSTKFYEDESNDFPAPEAKRQKRIGTNNFHTSVQKSSKFVHEDNETRRSSRTDWSRNDIFESEDEDINVHEADGQARTSQLETALPQIQTDEEAIEAYEAYKAGQAAEDSQHGDTIQSRMDSMTWTRGRSSIYVDAFNLALETVLDEEGHLFDQAEVTVFDNWKNLDYESQYLYVRLFLRKTSTWFRIGKLGYYSDIADMSTAVTDLQKERTLPKLETQTPSYPGEVVLPEEAVPLGGKFQFAECSDDHINTLDEASNLLLLDELKVIAKDAKVNGKNKRELLHNLRRTSGKQTGLGFVKRSETEESVDSDGNDPTLNYHDEDDASDGRKTPTSRDNRDAHFTKKILDQTGKCIRLSLVPLKLFERVHLVFYRSTEWTDKSLTTLILAKISRRNFPEYIVSRSTNIFETRSLLLEFEASLRTQFRVDNILEFSRLPVHRQVDEVKAIFEAVYPRWKLFLQKEQEKEDRVYETGEGAYLRRFSPGWVYTRIVHKGLWTLGRLKDHLREHGILVELLTQRLFHASRRGAWYQRKALLEEHYMYNLTDAEGRSEDTNKKHWKRIALKTCEDGLQDNECHVIYHYDLQKRIMKLEKQLKVPKREQHEFTHIKLSRAYERDVEGIQLKRERDDTPPAALRRSPSNHAKGTSLQRRSSAGTSHPNQKGQNLQATTSSTKNTPNPNIANRGRGFGTQTLWLDTLDTEEPVSVESMCLSHYRYVLGWKGYHSEGGVLRTLFGLLFYDILFHVYIPNVFQTAYQTCPLDLHTDAFYSARISEVNGRINEISSGKAEEILLRTWSEGYEKRLCIVGVRWDEYELEDLREIVKCFGGEKLGQVMRVVVQEYGNRGGGVPDLFLWKVGGSDGGEDKVMFVEVKSENDRLSDTQRLWISVLMNAGVEVELCHAIAKEVRMLE